MTENHDSSTAHDPSEKDGFADGRTLVIGLRGWNDAGDAASDAVSMVRRHLADRSELLWNCDDEVFFDYSLHRPMVQFNGGEREIVWPNIVVTGPKTRMSAAMTSPPTLECASRLQTRASTS